MSYSERSGSATFRPFQGSPTGDGRASSMVIYGGAKTTDSDVYRVGVYGWRKRCLYVLILFLIVVIIVNLALTIWIMRVLDFNMSGMGSLKILKDGVRITGRSEFEKPITFSKMTAGDDAPFIVESNTGVALHTTDAKNNATCSLIMDNLRIISNAGANFDGSIQTALIRPEAGQALSLESPTRSLNATAAQDVEIKSRSGNINVEALHDIKLESVTGEIHLNSPNIYVKSVMQAVESGNGVANKAYQVCLCTNGRMYLAHPGVNCRSAPEICR